MERQRRVEKTGCSRCLTRSQAGGRIGKPGVDFASPGGKNPERLRVQRENQEWLQENYKHWTSRNQD